jgi:hypothetical protein
MRFSKSRIKKYTIREYFLRAYSMVFFKMAPCKDETAPNLKEDQWVVSTFYKTIWNSRLLYSPHWNNHIFQHIQRLKHIFFFLHPFFQNDTQFRTKNHSHKTRILPLRVPLANWKPFEVHDYIFFLIGVSFRDFGCRFANPCERDINPITTIATLKPLCEPTDKGASLHILFGGTVLVYYWHLPHAPVKWLTPLIHIQKVGGLILDPGRFSWFS